MQARRYGSRGAAKAGLDVDDPANGERVAGAATRIVFLGAPACRTTIGP